MSATKGDIVNRMYALLEISGITVNPGVAEQSLARDVLDDMVAELQNSLDIPYLFPANYGGSGQYDDTGLPRGMIGPIIKLLAVEVCRYFGKEVTPTLGITAQEGRKQLVHAAVDAGTMQNPATLPIGSGNEYDYRSQKFYPEPNNDDGAENHYENEVFPIKEDWTVWLNGRAITSIEYDKDAQVTLTNISNTNDTSTATASFTQRGQFTVCISATANDGDVQTRRRVFNSVKCRNPGLQYTF